MRRARPPAEVAVAVDVDAPVATTWSVVTDWSRQGSWMPLTAVRVVEGDGAGVGSCVEAVTGVGRLSFVDTMRVVAWHPPHRCEVDHTGTVVRGAGVFEVVRLPGDRSRVVWTERLDLPLGAVGRAAWPLVRPLVALGLGVALRRLARLVRAAR